jgi:hypothetical protein
VTAPSRRLALLLGLAACAACATLAARRGTRADEQLIRMPHQKHREADIDCAVCHAEAMASTGLEGRLLPKEKSCLKCHREWKTEGRCDACHATGTPETWPAREPRVHFSHAEHLPKTNGDCAKCHLELPEPGRTEQGTTPMGTCLSCHEHQDEYDQARCMPCHVDLTRVPLRPVAYFSHQGDYVHQHRLAARTAPQACAQCHDQRYCADCHAQTVATPVELKFPERVDRQFIHRDDYVSRHAIEASADPALCLRCHAASYCDGCHRETGIAPGSYRATRSSNASPHAGRWSRCQTPQALPPSGSASPTGSARSA